MNVNRIRSCIRKEDSPTDYPALTEPQWISRRTDPKGEERKARAIKAEGVNERSGGSLLGSSELYNVP